MSRKQKMLGAVAELRSRLNVDQTEFAQLLGKSYPMARRYETEVPPADQALAPFAILAHKNGCTDLAELFREALIEDLPDVVKALSLKTPSSSSDELIRIPASLVPEVEWFVDLFKHKGTPEEELFKDTVRLIVTGHNADSKRARARKNQNS